MPGLYVQHSVKPGTPFPWLLASTGWEEASAQVQAGVRMIIWYKLWYIIEQAQVKSEKLHDYNYGVLYIPYYTDDASL